MFWVIRNFTKSLVLNVVLIRFVIFDQNNSNFLSIRSSASHEYIIGYELQFTAKKRQRYSKERTERRQTGSQDTFRKLALC